MYYIHFKSGDWTGWKSRSLDKMIAQCKAMIEGCTVSKVVPSKCPFTGKPSEAFERVFPPKQQ